MIASARIAAFRILTSITAGDADLPAAVARARHTLADERDRALVSEIATGVQRWRAALDFVIARFARRPFEKLDREVVEILRLSAYQLLHLTRVPASAVVDDAVELTRRAGKRSASGFVNAVLRAIARERHRLPLPPRPDDPADRDAALDYFSIALSHPRWLAARWYDRLGFDAAERWLQFNNTPARLTLRVNRLKLNREDLAATLHARGVRTAMTRFAPDGLIVEHGHPIDGLEEGLFVIQDEASQLVALLADARPGSSVLDTCASPGGKTTAIAARMEDRGLIVACDVRPRRMALLARTVAASGARCVRLVQADLMRPLPFTRRFDCVFVDAPCSGLGTLRRDPDIKWRRREEEIAALAEAELAMLRHAAECVAPGGRLVYATCSSEPEENERVADAFLATNDAFVAFDLNRVAGALPQAVISARGCFTTSPDAHGLEAFFGAAFVRNPVRSGDL